MNQPAMQFVRKNYRHQGMGPEIEATYTWSHGLRVCVAYVDS